MSKLLRIILCTGEPFAGPVGLSPPPNSTVTVSAINCLGQQAMEVAIQ